MPRRRRLRHEGPQRLRAHARLHRGVLDRHPRVRQRGLALADVKAHLPLQGAVQVPGPDQRVVLRRPSARRLPGARPELAGQGHALGAGRVAGRGSPRGGQAARGRRLVLADGSRRLLRAPAVDVLPAHPEGEGSVHRHTRLARRAVGVGAPGRALGALGPAHGGDRGPLPARRGVGGRQLPATGAACAVLG